MIQWFNDLFLQTTKESLAESGKETHAHAAHDQLWNFSVTVTVQEANAHMLYIEQCAP